MKTLKSAVLTVTMMAMASSVHGECISPGSQEIEHTIRSRNTALLVQSLADQGLSEEQIVTRINRLCALDVAHESEMLVGAQVGGDGATDVAGGIILAVIIIAVFAAMAGP